jgi:hypothetical protein
MMANDDIVFAKNDFKKLAQRYGEKGLWFLSKQKMEKIYQDALEKNQTAAIAINNYLDRPFVNTSDGKSLCVGSWFQYDNRVWVVKGIKRDGSINATEYSNPGWHRTYNHVLSQEAISRIDLSDNSIYIGTSIPNDLKKLMESSGRYYKK